MLACRACGRTVERGPREPWRCACGHALDFAPPLSLAGDPPGAGTLDRDRGLWAFAEFLPVDRRITLGEGWTPLVAADRWDASFKLEYLSPSGSFKDRGAAVTLSRAVALGVDGVVEDSSGNAGAAVALYAARAGVPARVYVPADASAGKVRAIESAGADVVRVEGDRGDVAAACVRAVEHGAGWYASHAWRPSFYAGTATVALELAAQRDWTVPDVVVTPLGHGTLFLGAYRGFRALRDAGWTARLPRLVGVQAAGAAPFVAARHGERAAAGDNGVADGIQVRDPARRDQVLDAVAATGGEVLAVGGEATATARGALARAGFRVEPTSAAAVAGLEAARRDGVVGASDETAVVLTGAPSG